MAFDQAPELARQQAPVARPRSRIRIVGALAVLVALAVAGFFAIKGLTGDGDEAGTLKGSGANAYTMLYPENWRPLSKDQLRALPGSPLAVIRREDGKGFVVVRAERRAPSDFTTFAGGLTTALKKRISDFQKRTSKTVRIRAGEAFFYSYIRRKKGTVNTVVIVPAGKRSYAINTVSSGGARDAAREIAKMILSFDVPK